MFLRFWSSIPLTLSNYEKFNCESSILIANLLCWHLYGSIFHSMSVFGMQTQYGLVAFYLRFRVTCCPLITVDERSFSWWEVATTFEASVIFYKLMPCHMSVSSASFRASCYSYFLYINSTQNKELNKNSGLKGHRHSRALSRNLNKSQNFLSYTSLAINVHYVDMTAIFVTKQQISFT